MERITIDFTEKTYFLNVPRNASYEVQLESDRIRITRYDSVTERKEGAKK